METINLLVANLPAGGCRWLRYPLDPREALQGQSSPAGSGKAGAEPLLQTSLWLLPLEASVQELVAAAGSSPGSGQRTCAPVPAGSRHSRTPPSRAASGGRV